MLEKKYLNILMVLLVIILVGGCSDQSYEEYQSAVEKTENLKSGKYSIEIEYQTNFNENELTVEEFKKLSNFSNLKFSGVNVFNRSMNVMNFYGNLESSNLGLDLEYYQKGQNKYLKIPILGKYIDLNDFNAEEFSQGMSFDMSESIDINMNEDAFEKIGILWSKAIQEENVFKGKKSLLETPDGDVKVTEYTIEFSDELLKYLVKETMVILEISDEVDLMNQITIESFNYSALVDIDGLIIQEDFAMDYSLEDVVEVDSGHFAFKILNYDLNKEQKIEMPDVNESMLLDLNQMNDFLEDYEDVNLGETNE